MCQHSQQNVFLLYGLSSAEGHSLMNSSQPIYSIAHIVDSFPQDLLLSRRTLRLHLDSFLTPLPGRPLLHFSQLVSTITPPTADDYTTSCLPYAL